MKRSPFIEQIMVIGEGEKMPSALIQPDFEYVRNWLLKNKSTFSDDLKNICTNKDLLLKIELEINKINENLVIGKGLKSLKSPLRFGRLKMVF